MIAEPERGRTVALLRPSFSQLLADKSWLPAEFAHEGRILKLRDEERHWDDGWVVREVGNTVSEEHLTLTDQMLHRMLRERQSHK